MATILSPDGDQSGREYPSPAGHHFISFGYLILDAKMYIGEGAAKHTSESFDAFRAACILWACRIMAYVVRGEKLVCYVQVPLAVQDLINHPSNDGLILFRHRASIPFADNAQLLAPTATMAPRSEDVKGRALGMLEMPGGRLPLFTSCLEGVFYELRQ
jgi:hypothetical protein